MEKKQSKAQFIITAALIAALYAGLTYVCAYFNLAYGPIQLRISEVLTILPVFTPAAIPGLIVGCFLANIGSFNALDMVFGTMATAVAAVLTYAFKNVRLKDIPLLSLAPPVLINALIIGLEIAFFFLPEGFTLWGFAISGLQVGAGQLIVCYGLGIPFYLLVKKHKIFTKYIGP